MPKRRQRGSQWPPRDETRNALRNERAVELSIRGAEIVRILAALAEEVGAMAAEEESDEISFEAHGLAESLVFAATRAADLTGSLANRSLQLYRSHDTLAPRCAILSRDAAHKVARSIRTYRRRTMEKGA